MGRLACFLFRLAARLSLTEIRMTADAGLPVLLYLGTLSERVGVVATVIAGLVVGLHRPHAHVAPPPSVPGPAPGGNSANS